MPRSVIRVLTIRVAGLPRSDTLAPLAHDEFRLKRRDRFSLAPLAGRGRMRPTAAVLYRRTPMRSIGYGDGDSPQIHARGQPPSPGLHRTMLRIAAAIRPLP